MVEAGQKNDEVHLRMTLRAILMYFLVFLSSLERILPSSLYECLYDNVLTSFQGRSD